MEKKKLKSVLESLLFVSGEPVKTQKLAKICKVSKNEAQEALMEMDKEYGENRGLRIISKGDSRQLVSSPENAPYANQLVSGELRSELSKPALETLAIVAYRGPVTRAQIEVLRGVNCSYTLRSLLMRGLVERKETSDIRGFLYEISFDFLKYMGIQKASGLPDWEALSKNEKIDAFLKASREENEPEKIQ